MEEEVPILLAVSMNRVGELTGCRRRPVLNESEKSSSPEYV